ncbi:MAG TPA: YggT family protein [Acidimicrobiia bacterium]|nr:YggT family protein [Acidimicrobiia bacterium]
MSVLCFVLQAMTLVIFARIVLEWIPVSYDHPLARVRAVLRAITEPILGPVRRLLPPMRMGEVALDLSPLIVILLLSVVTGRVC